MKPDLLDPTLPAIDTLLGYDAVCVLVTEDERPLSGAAGLIDWRLCGALSRVLKDGFFAGTPGERLLISSDGRVPVPKIFAVGVGQARAVTPLGLEHALKNAAGMLHKAQATSAALALPRLPLDEAAYAGVVKRAFCDGFTGRKVGVFAEKALRAKLADG